MVNTSAKGATAERRLRAELEEKGHLLLRAAASLGCVDLVDLTDPCLYSVKSVGRNSNMRTPTWTRELKTATERAHPVFRRELRVWRWREGWMGP